MEGRRSRAGERREEERFRIEEREGGVGREDPPEALGTMVRPERPRLASSAAMLAANLRLRRSRAAEPPAGILGGGYGLSWRGQTSSTGPGQKRR